MKPTSEQVQAWSDLWYSCLHPPCGYKDFIAQCAAEWAAEECAKICDSDESGYGYDFASVIREWSKK